jgi:hypothetical protein
MLEKKRKIINFLHGYKITWTFTSRHVNSSQEVASLRILMPPGFFFVRVWDCVEA